MYIICTFLCRCLSSPVSHPLLSYCHYFICTLSVPSCVDVSSSVSPPLLSYCHYFICTSSVPSCVDVCLRLSHRHYCPTATTLYVHHLYLPVSGVCPRLSHTHYCRVAAQSWLHSAVSLAPLLEGWQNHPKPKEILFTVTLTSSAPEVCRRIDVNLSRSMYSENLKMFPWKSYWWKHTRLWKL